MKAQKKYLLALDQGTTASRAVLFDFNFKPVAVEKMEFAQIYPKEGWVEHDPMEILKTQLGVIEKIFGQKKFSPSQVAAIGIANQRETTIVWNKKTGVPVYNAIVWQCRRTSDFCSKLKKESFGKYIRETTGLAVDAYFSATKIKWILDNVKGARKLAEKGELCFGTVDSWLVWNLSGKTAHVSDYTNASRTMLFDIKKLRWDQKILKRLNIPPSILPKVVESSGKCAQTALSTFGNEKIPICAIAGDQQAALFGHNCRKSGEIKNTYGTGCFMLANTAQNFVKSKSGMLSTLSAQTRAQKPMYALEGSVFMAGAIAQWLRDEMKILEKSSDMGKIAASVESSGGVYLVPAFTGLGAPHWNMYARAAIFGMTRGTGRTQIIRAAEEAIAYQTRDLFEAMRRDIGRGIKSMRVDGGASADEFLMQFQSDILGCKIERQKNTEITALGVAMLAALAIGLKGDDKFRAEKTFRPKMSSQKKKSLLLGWESCVKKLV